MIIDIHPLKQKDKILETRFDAISFSQKSKDSLIDRL